MSDSQRRDEAGKTELDLSAGGMPHPVADAMATFIMPDPALERQSQSRGDAARTELDLSGEGTSPPVADALATFILTEGAEESSPADGPTAEPGPASGTGDTAAFVMPPETDSDRTLVSGMDPTLNERSRKTAGGAVTNVSIKGYLILGELGRGGMGVVYRARQQALNRTVALKMIIAAGHAGSEQLARFRAEAEAVAQLQHPNIVQVYDIGEQDGLPYFSLEFVDGSSLDRDLAGKPQPEKKAAQYIETLARAMQYAHDHNIIHRDLKPPNVLLTKAGVLKISDFGLAKQMESDSSQTRTGTIMGTPSYMAPEQGRGEKTVGPLADVYALGSMLYEMITGRPPFLAETAFKTLMRLLKEEPVPPSRIQPGVSRDLETICMKCLQKDPGRRYDSAAALADDLRRFQAGETILARPVSRPEKAWRWCKRNPRLAVLYGTVGVLFVAVGISLTVIKVRADREREARAENEKRELAAREQTQRQIEEARQQAQQRLEQATEAVSSGNFRKAQDLLLGSDPILASAAELSELRQQLAELDQQIKTYADFRRLFDNARYLGLFGGPALLAKARQASHELIALYDLVDKREGAGEFGWPPLNDRQKELLQEDIFEAFLVAAKVEHEAATPAPGDTSEAATAAFTQATRQSIAWLNRAELILPPTKALYVWRAPFYVTVGDQAAAEADAKRSSEIKPTSTVDRYWHAFADYLRGENFLYQKKDPAAAGNSYRLAATGYAKVVESRPESFWAYYSWANCLAKLGDRYGAVVGYSTCIRLNPEAPWTYNNRGLVHLQLKEFDLAIADIETAIRLNPDEPTGYLRRAEYFFALQDYGHAQQDYTAAIRLKPDDVTAYRNRAIVSMFTKDLDASLADWKELIKLTPDSHEPHYYIGAILLGRQELEPALIELETAIRLQPTDVQSHMARAMVCRWQGQFDAALAELNLILTQFVPNRHDYFIERADYYRALGKFDEALDDYQKCLGMQPKQIDGYLGMAFVYDQMGKPAQARDCIERMVKADPAVLTGHLRRAEYLLHHDDFDAATADCDQAGKIDPQSILPGLVRAEIKAARGDYVQAVQDAEALLAKAPPHDSKILYAAVCVYSLAAKASAARSGDADAAKLREEYSQRAVQYLKEVVETCFHDLEYPEHNRMAWDPALQAIRGLPEIEKLLSGRK